MAPAARSKTRPRPVLRLGPVGISFSCFLKQFALTRRDARARRPPGRFRSHNFHKTKNSFYPITTATTIAVDCLDGRQRGASKAMRFSGELCEKFSFRRNSKRLAQLSRVHRK